MRKAAPGTFPWMRLVLVVIALVAAALSQTLDGPWSMRAALLGAAVICLLEATGEIEGFLAYVRSKVPHDPVEFGDMVGDLVMATVLILLVLVWLY